MRKKRIILSMPISVFTVLFCFSCVKTYVVPEPLSQTAVISEETITLGDLTLTFGESLGTIPNLPEGLRSTRKKENDLYSPEYDCVMGVSRFNKDLTSANPKDNIFRNFKLFFLDTGYSSKGRQAVPTQYKSAQFPDFEITCDMTTSDLCLLLEETELEYKKDRNISFLRWTGEVSVDDYKGLRLKFHFTSDDQLNFVEIIKLRSRNGKRIM